MICYNFTLFIQFIQSLRVCKRKFDAMALSSNNFLNLWPGTNADQCFHHKYHMIEYEISIDLLAYFAL